MSESDPMIHVLVEDDGLAAFLGRTLELTPVHLASIKVIPCGGWSGVFARYEHLTQAGCSPQQIVPVLDANKIGERFPRERAVLDSLNLFRLSYDLEFAFENWMLAEALIRLRCSPFGDDSSPRNYLACERLVRYARSTSVETGDTLYQCLTQRCREEYARQGYEQAAFVPPSKMQLALAVAEIVRSAREFPSELAALIKHLENIARTAGLALTSSDVSPDSITLHSDTIEAVKLSGKILLSVSEQPYPRLWLIDFDRRELRPIRDMAYASWSPDGKSIAGMALMHTSPEYRRKSVLIIEESGVERGWVSTRTPIGAEGHPCWYPDGLSLILRTDKGTFKVSRDAKRWELLYKEETAHHCVSCNGRIARTRGGVLEIGSRGGNEPYHIVPDTTDVRGAVSWSSSGRYVAFANLVSSDSGAVCIYDCRARATKFLTSHHGFPYFVCFSPDEHFVLFTWRDQLGRSSLRIVDVESRVVSTVLDGASLELIVGCHAWRSTSV